MKTTGIIAFDYDIIPIINYLYKQKRFNNESIILASSYPGWGFVNNDISSYIHGIKENIVIEIDKSKDIIDKSDIIIFNESRKNYEIEKFILKNIDILSEKEKIISLKEIENPNIKNILSHNLVVYNNKADLELDPDDITLSNIDTPIIIVSGICENLGKLQFSLELDKFFRENSYNPLLITSKSYSNFFDALPIPFFMFDEIIEKDKIILFNKFISKLNEERNPDLIIIEIPGGIIKLNENIDNFFGTLHYEITEAVEPDLTLLNLPFDYFNDKYFFYLNNLLNYRYNSEHNLFYINPVMLDFINKDIQGNVSLVDVSKSTIKKHFEDNICDKENCFVNIEDILNRILDILQNNGSYEIF